MSKYEYMRIRGYSSKPIEVREQKSLGNIDIEHLYVEKKCQLVATEVFIADLIACSTCFGHH